MASPFVPVPFPMDKGSRNKPRRPQRASSLGSVSGSLESSLKHQSRNKDKANRSRTPPPLQSPVTRARMNGMLDPSVEYSSCPRSVSDPSGSQQIEERPITPTVLGYEVMEERAKFTVYKILVRKTPDQSWVVFRRYTDFSRLNDKLKEIFPGFRLSLPPKRWFKDNYDSDFLEDRQLGLQAFLQNLVAHKDIANCVPVREFLCLDDPPGPFDSLEESRAFCETLEESNYRLQKELLEKQKEIVSLKRKLEERERAFLLLEKHMKSVDCRHTQVEGAGTHLTAVCVCVCLFLSGECVTPESPCGLSAQGSESSAEVDVELSAAEADQDMSGDAG
uniref:Sorting nexin-16 n=1 Tax=Nothobranchius furzeri TaxID=105023 RepID=A0A8C6PV73_NOTFU